MQVYIEYVVLNNLLINALVLTLALKFTRWKINKLAVFLSSAIGTVYAVLLPLYDWLNIFILKILLSMAMVGIIAGKCKIKKYIVLCVVFFALTFALGGITSGIENIFSVNSGKVSASLVPFYVGTGGIVLICLYKLLYKYITLAKRKNSFESEIIIAANGKKIKCKAYFDSGNKLYFHNKPTVIIDKSVALELYEPNELINIKDNTKVNTVSGEQKLKVFPLEYLEVENTKDKIYGVMAAISDCIKGEYKVVLHCDL